MEFFELANNFEHSAISKGMYEAVTYFATYKARGGGSRDARGQLLWRRWIECT